MPASALPGSTTATSTSSARRRSRSARAIPPGIASASRSSWTSELSGVGLIGAGWISAQYAAALRALPGATLVGVASRSRERAEALAARSDAPVAVDFEALDRLLDAPGLEVVCVNSPNALHAEHAIRALRAGKHVVIEKPLCLTLDEADRIATAAHDAQRGVGYAENLLFAPAYREARRILRAGTLGEIRWVRQCEKHAGPYSPWFFEPELAGGGALADMGCHGIELLLWLFERPRVVRVRARLATLQHAERTSLDDDAHVELELESGLRLISESSWALQGGMQSTLEVHGSTGSLRVDLLGETGVSLYTPDHGWTRPLPDSLRANGYVGELAHFLDAFTSGRPPESGLEHGRHVLELLCAAYASAALDRDVALPYDASGSPHPAAIWLASR